MWIAVRNAVWLQTALKTLMVIHRLMRESNISFVEEVGSCVHACYAFCINADIAMASLPVIALLVKQAVLWIMTCQTRLHSTDSSLHDFAPLSTAHFHCYQHSNGQDHSMSCLSPVAQ